MTTPETALSVEDLIKPSGDNLTGDLVEIGIKKNSEEFHDDLRWWFRYAHVAKTWSQADAATQLGIDSGTYSKVMRGEYKNGQGLLLPPPAKMLSRIRILAQQERDITARLNVGRVMTPTVSDIHNICRLAWDTRQIGMVFGNSHIGKTEGLKWFRDENNHGATIFVDLQGCCGVQDVYRAFARALKLSDSAPINKLMPRIYASIDRTNLVICDELHAITHAYQKRGAVVMLNAIKAIKDRADCGMVVCGTNVARDEFETGVDKNLLKQLWRRGVLKLQLPDALPVGDVRAWAQAYKLYFPAAPEKAANDVWKKFHLDHPNFAGGKVCDSIAHDFGILHLKTTLITASSIAKNAKRAVTWDDVSTTHETFTNMALRKVA
jgi:DNA transposition AAA+ family ATPase